MNMSKCSKEVNSRFFNYSLSYSFFYSIQLSLIHLSELVRYLTVSLSQSLLTMYMWSTRKTKNETVYTYSLSCSFMRLHLEKKEREKSMNNQSTLLFFLLFFRSSFIYTGSHLIVFFSFFFSLSHSR